MSKCKRDIENNLSIGLALTLRASAFSLLAGTLSSQVYLKCQNEFKVM